jgi:hypothetical protein
VISLIGTGVSIMEAGILRDQQQLMVEEKAAAVWPYLESSTSAIKTEKGIEIKMVLTNKGVGPALLSDITFSTEGKYGKRSDLTSVLSKNHPGLVLLNTFTRNSMKEVLAAQEELIAYKVLIFPRPGEASSDNSFEKTLQDFNSLNEAGEIIDAISSTYCYCSIYGDCWDSDNQPLLANEACSGKEMVRRSE